MSHCQNTNREFYNFLSANLREWFSEPLFCDQTVSFLRFQYYTDSHQFFYYSSMARLHMNRFMNSFWRWDNFGILISSAGCSPAEPQLPSCWAPYAAPPGPSCSPAGPQLPSRWAPCASCWDAGWGPSSRALRSGNRAMDRVLQSWSSDSFFRNERCFRPGYRKEK